MSADLIKRRRAQMLVHSFAYYVLDESIVTDDTWQRWADELVELQRGAPAKIGFYDPEFQDWDGSTGMHLPQDGWVSHKARHVLALHNRLNAQAPPAAPARPAPAVQASLF